MSGAGLSSDAERVDVAVLGGGPAGATAATLLTRAGLSVAVFERSQFPRFHIGESLMTETWWIFERLGVLDELRASAFPRKHSVQFINEHGRASRPFYFSDTNPHESAITWQVDRAEFDQILIENAERAGASVHFDTEVREVLFEGETAVGVRVRHDGVTRDVASKVVLDASGLHAILARQLGLIEPDPKLRKAAIFAHFEGAHRDEGRDEGATLIINTAGNRGWFWSIPLPHDRVSIGRVGAPDELIKGRGSPREVLLEEIERHPTMRERLAAGRIVGNVHVTSDFSYRSRRVSGDGWVLVGDAFGFIDPVYSSGVFLALKSAEMAADAIVDALRGVGPKAAVLGRFGVELNAGLEAMRKLVYAFYTPGFSFADFVRQHPEHAPRLVDLLIGNVFKPGVTDIFQDMSSFCDLPTERPLTVG